MTEIMLPIRSEEKFSVKELELGEQVSLFGPDQSREFLLHIPENKRLKQVLLHTSLRTSVEGYTGVQRRYVAVAVDRSQLLENEIIQPVARDIKQFRFAKSFQFDPRWIEEVARLRLQRMRPIHGREEVGPDQSSLQNGSITFVLGLGRTDRQEFGLRIRFVRAD